MMINATNNDQSADPLPNFSLENFSIFRILLGLLDRITGLCIIIKVVNFVNNILCFGLIK